MSNNSTVMLPQRCQPDHAAVVNSSLDVMAFDKSLNGKYDQKSKTEYAFAPLTALSCLFDIKELK